MNLSTRFKNYAKKQGKEYNAKEFILWYHGEEQHKLHPWENKQQVIYFEAIKDTKLRDAVKDELDKNGIYLTPKNGKKLGYVWGMGDYAEGYITGLKVYVILNLEINKRFYTNDSAHLFSIISYCQDLTPRDANLLRVRERVREKALQVDYKEFSEYCSSLVKDKTLPEKQKILDILKLVHDIHKDPL